MTISLDPHMLVARADRPAPGASEACGAVIAKHSKSFALAARLLPKRCRDDATAVYAWCRRADDAIDHSPAEDLAASLDLLHDELRRIYEGSSFADPVLASFQRVAFDRRIPLSYPLELLEGMRMDKEGTRYDRLDDLFVYGHRVAGVVGLMMCHVLGIGSDDALPHAAHLGIAMQLTNIARDVDEDRRSGRLYLPREGLSPRALAALDQPAGELAPDVRDELTEPLRQLLHQAQRLYRSGDEGLVYLDAPSARAIRTARLVYSEIGDEVARRGFDVGLGRAHVSTARKLLLVGRAYLESAVFASNGRTSTKRLNLPTRVLECSRVVRSALSAGA